MAQEAYITPSTEDPNKFDVVVIDREGSNVLLERVSTIRSAVEWHTAEMLKRQWNEDAANEE